MSHDITIENIVKRHVNKLNMKKLAQWIVNQENISSPIKITIVLVDDEFITELNKTFLAKKSATDVLSFNLSEPDEAFGEIYISVETAERHAKEYRVSVENELYRLVAHGTYHLLGYDDASEEQKITMTALEDKALEYICST